AAVPDTQRSRSRVLAQVSGQVGDATGPLADVQPARGQRRHTGGVVAAVLQPAEPLEQNGFGRARTDITDDATHGARLPGGNGKQKERAAADGTAERGDSVSL